jgi:hypothetical protein
VMELARIAALAGDGRTAIEPARDAAIGFRALPVALHLFEDGLWVRSAKAPHSSLAGARVVKIGGATAEQAIERARPYVSRDNEMGLRHAAPRLLAMPEALHALGLSSTIDSARFEVEQGGERRTVWLRATGPAEALEDDADLGWRPRADWVDARDAGYAPEPLWLRRDPDSVSWWFAPVPGTRTLYAQVHRLRDAPREKFDAFARRLLAKLDSGGTDRLVLDLRTSRGGDSALARPLVRGLVRRPVNERGRLIVLIGRGTAGAAQQLAAELERYSEAVLIGEPTSSRGYGGGGAQEFRLPHSGVRVTVAERVDHARDATAWTVPEVAAAMSFADYRSNRDPALEAALAYKPRPSLVDDLRVLVAANDTLGVRQRLALFRADPANAWQDLRSKLDSVATRLDTRTMAAAMLREIGMP